MPKPIAKRTDEQLMADHAAIYKKFLPTLDSYTDMAKQVLELQIEIARRRLVKELPGAEFSENVLLATFSARETPAKLDQLLVTMREKGVTAEKITYDPMSFAFHVYGKATP